MRWSLLLLVVFLVSCVPGDFSTIDPSDAESMTLPFEVNFEPHTSKWSSNICEFLVVRLEGKEYNIVLPDLPYAEEKWPCYDPYLGRGGRCTAVGDTLERVSCIASCEQENKNALEASELGRVLTELSHRSTLNFHVQRDSKGEITKIDSRELRQILNQPYLSLQDSCR